VDPLSALFITIARWLLVLAVAFGGGWWYGSSGKRELEREIQASVEKRRSDVATFVVSMSKREQDAREQLALERSRDHTVYVTLKKEVPVYVTAKADAGCVITRGFVQHHDAAWRGAALPEAPSGSVDAASGIPLSRVADVNAENAAVCRDLRHEAEAWRAWYVGVSIEWDAFLEKIAGRSPPKSDGVPQAPG
jgi:hypothetical protein